MKKLLTATAIGLALLTWHTSCTQQPKAPEAFTPIKVETPARPTGHSGSSGKSARCNPTRYS